MLYPWQIQPYQALSRTFLNGRGHHALLFKTESGLGTPHLIRHFADWLLCRQPQDNQPCGQCKSCLLQQHDNHPDFHLIESIDDKDIGVEQIREATSHLQHFAQQGGNVVVYLTAAERLTEAAANALLKTLEEPPQNCYFLLQAPLASTILATIQSRCQTWLLHSPTKQETFEWLQQHFPQTTTQEIETALRLCRQRPLLCKNLLESDRLSQRKTFLRTFWLFYKSQDIWLLLSAFDKEIPQILEQLDWLASFFSDSLKLRLNIGNDLLNGDLQKGIFSFSQQCTTQQLLKGHQILHQTQRDLREINGVNAELMLMDCLTKLVLDVFENEKNV